MTDLETIILKDDATPTGDTSFAGETLEDFLLNADVIPKQPLDNADKWHIDNHLSQNSIKPVFNTTKNDAFIALYKRLFNAIDTYCEEHDLCLISHSLLSKNNFLITKEVDYKNAKHIDLDITAPSMTPINSCATLKPLTTNYNTIDDYLQEQLKAVIKNIKDAAHNFNADESFRDLWSDDYYLTPSEFLQQLQEDEEFLHNFAKQKD